MLIDIHAFTPSGGHDAWQAWAIDLLRQYSECAARHAKTVQAWPK